MKVYAKSERIDYSKTLKENLPILEFLFETNNLEFGDRFSFGGKLYSFCSYSPYEDMAIVEEFQLKELAEYDYQYTNEVICPYCGQEDHDSWELSDESDDAYCENCGGTFGYTRDVTVSYYSEKVKEPEIKEVTE